MSIQSADIQLIEPAVKQYLDYMQAYSEGEEIQYRTPFENLVNAINAIRFSPMNISVVQEDRRSNIDIDGMPDFFVYQDDTSLFKKLVGFIECKKPSYNLDKLIESEQIKKYAKTTENIIITNYRRFILLQNNPAKGKIEKTQHDFELKTADIVSVTKLINLFSEFYQYEYQYIRTKKTLANVLAAQSFYYSVALREFIANKNNENEPFFVKFNNLFREYENSVNYYYELADFCDIYSQSLVYGLLLARLDTDKDFDEQKLDYLRGIPTTYRLLYEFLSQAYEERDLPTDIKIALTNIGRNLNLINVSEIQKEFQNTNNGKQSIAVYLYEDFLAQYDKFRGTENRKEGGVYYTPSAATDFITRGVNEIIKTKFGFSGGYNSQEVKVLDFACGTGTFLHSVFEQMLPKKLDDLEKITVKNKIKNDIYGFELLFTPYIIAHTILTRYLLDKGIKLDDKNDRLGIYLTNTLDISQHSISSLLPELKNEYEKSQGIKNTEKILAIIGNPPYFNGKSKEKQGIIDSELNKYYAGIKETKINKDLYEKFIRFAELKIEKKGQGVIGIITNNSYLDAPTKRGIRKHLYETFDEIYILNLHGNTRKGDSDKNIFDIMVGVSIVFFVKLEKPVKKKTVKYFSTLDNNIIKRQEKLDFLENNAITELNWKNLNPKETEYYWFVEKDFSYQKEYKRFVKLTEIFANVGSAIKTDRDELVINYSKRELTKNMKTALETDFYYLTPEFREKYKIKNSSSYAFIDRVKNEKFNEAKIKKIEYRPFDYRNIYYSIGFTSRPAENITKHFEYKNLGLCFSRQLLGEKWQNIFVSENFVDVCTVSLKSRESTYVAPLYHYNGGHGYAELDFDGHNRYANFTQNFIKKYIEKLSFLPTPEETLAYIYAVLHSKIYREKYIEFLKTDFPAVPMTTEENIFRKYSELGQKLIDLHLLKNISYFENIESSDSKISVSGDLENSFVVEKIIHADNKLILTATDNKNIIFEGVTSEIYDFEIGSYRPIEKWLKYRIKDKVELSTNDIRHIKNMIIAIKNTIEIMREIEVLGETYL